MPLPENPMRVLAFAFLLVASTVGAAEVATPQPLTTPEVATSVAPAEAADDEAIEPVDQSAEDTQQFADPAAAGANADEQAAVRAALRKAPAVDPAPADPALRPVLDQFGGEPGLVALMDEFMVRLLADPRMRPFFAQVDQAAVKRHLVEQFCAILGGGCAYTGRDMRTTHAGLGIERADFNALVEDLQQAMDAKGIPFRAQNRLLAKLAPMHREVEEK
jgi:hemoglobin